jgi:EAL domain-containing protein (putative c-di-GMP-specific phosphodiesterase class I)
MTHSDDDAEIVRWTVDLARSLGLQAVAEGVESAEIQHGLSAIGCPSAQGFHIARPIPAGEFLAWALCDPLERILDDMPLGQKASQRDVLREAL